MVRKEKRKMEKASKEREKKKGKVIGNCQSKNYSGCNDAKYTICKLYIGTVIYVTITLQNM